VHFTLTKDDGKPAPQGRVTYNSDKGSPAAGGDNLDKLPPYKVYELWLIPQDGRDPIPAGTFHPDDRRICECRAARASEGDCGEKIRRDDRGRRWIAAATLPIVLKDKTS